MDINTGAEQESRYTAARFNEKGCFKDWGGDALRMLHNVLPPKTSKNFGIFTVVLL